MATMIAFHSFRRGTGRTNLLVSLALILARQGKRVGMIDTNMQSPSVHNFFKMRDKQIGYTLDNYLWGECALEQVVYDVGETVGVEENHLVLIPSSDNMVRIMRVLKDGIDIGVLTDAFSKFANMHNLDILLLDSSSGITEDILLSMSVVDVLAIVMRLDEQDYQGVGMTLDLAKRLNFRKSILIVNQVASSFDLLDVKRKIKDTFHCEVGAVLPYSDDFLDLASEEIFTLKFPEHPLTLMLEELAAKL